MLLSCLGHCGANTFLHRLKQSRENHLMNSSPVKGRRSATPLLGGFKKTFLKPQSWSDSSHQPKPNGVCSWSRHMWNMCWSFGVSCRTCSWKGQETWERAAQTCWEKNFRETWSGVFGLSSCQTNRGVSSSEEQPFLTIDATEEKLDVLWPL